MGAVRVVERARLLARRILVTASPEFDPPEIAKTRVIGRQWAESAWTGPERSLGLRGGEVFDADNLGLLHGAGE